MPASDSWASLSSEVRAIHDGCALFTVNSGCGRHEVYCTRPNEHVVSLPHSSSLAVSACLPLVFQISDSLVHALSACNTCTTTVEVPAIAPSTKYRAPSSAGQRSHQGEAHLQH